MQQPSTTAASGTGPYPLNVASAGVPTDAPPMSKNSVAAFDAPASPTPSTLIRTSIPVGPSLTSPLVADQASACPATISAAKRAHPARPSSSLGGSASA